MLEKYHAKVILFQSRNAFYKALEVSEEER